LSVGDRVRVVLSSLSGHDPDVLLLDEPTNHLDIASMEAIEKALQSFPGGVLFTTHDRAFAMALADDIVDLSGGS
jgi:ATPase subunit of ABC transporter with duplicated ATPase domains